MDTQGGLIDRHRPLKVTSWSRESSEDHDEDRFLFRFPRLIFELTLPLNHQELLLCQVRDVNGSIRRRILDPIRQDIRSIFRHLYQDDRERRVKELNIQIAILQALERLSEYEDSPPSDPEPKHRTRYSKGWAVDEISDWNDVVNNPYGLDASTIRDTASDLLGMTPSEIVKQIPDSWRVIHMESVLREDLLKRFKRYQSSLHTVLTANPSGLRNKLAPHSTLQGRVKSVLAMEDVIDDMLKPRMTFHGTQLKSVRSIIRHGFLLPGKLINGQRIESPRSGIAFDRGIYSSQAASYAMSFARGQQEHTPLGTLPSMRLFVCATIMGRTYTPKLGPHSVHGKLIEGYDSHFDGGFEYIIHEERAMLPCYVIHLDLGSAEAQRALLAAQSNPFLFQQHLTASRSKENPHPRLSDAPALSPGDLKREQEAKKAAAMKWFPYGFGSASGTNFVIEEIGEVSEDEEEYGEWQEDKHAYVPQGTLDDDEAELEAYESWDEDEGKMVIKMVKQGLFMDQYQSARTVEEKRKVKTKRVCDDTLI